MFVAVLMAIAVVVGKGCRSPRGGDMHPEGMVDSSVGESVMVEILMFLPRIVC